MLVLAACGIGDDANADSSANPVPTPSDTAPANAEPEQDNATVAEFVADAPLVVGEFASLSLELDSTWRVDTLQTPFTFSVTDELAVFANEDSYFVVASPTATEPSDRSLQFIRPTRLSDPTDPNFDLTPTRGWDLQDVDGWLDAMPAGLAITGRTETSVGGLPALRYDATVTEDARDCFTNQPCATFGEASPWSAIIAKRAFHYRVWAVDLGEVEPVIIVAGYQEADSDWLDIAERVVDTVAFGEVEPNAIRLEDAGVIELNVHDGVRLTSARPFTLHGDLDGSAALADLTWRTRDIEFLTRPNNLEGNPIENSDALVAYLDDNDFSVNELDPTAVGGIDTRVFEVAASGFFPVLSRTSETAPNYAPPPRGRWWVTDHPQRGLLITAAELFDPAADPDQFAEVVAWGEELVASLEFIGEGPPPQADTEEPPTTETTDAVENSPEELIGTWQRIGLGVTWTIGPDAVEITGGVIDAASYSATATTLEWTDLSGPQACSPTQVGSYAWVIADNELRLMLVSDPCSGRSNALNGATFQRVE